MNCNVCAQIKILVLYNNWLVCVCLSYVAQWSPTASLLGMLSKQGDPAGTRRISSSSSKQSQQRQQTAGNGTVGTSKRLTGCDLEHLQQLHVFFSGLVDDMAAAVQRLAMQGFNQWLVGLGVAIDDTCKHL